MSRQMKQWLVCVYCRFYDACLDTVKLPLPTHHQVKNHVQLCTFVEYTKIYTFPQTVSTGYIIQW